MIKWLFTSQKNDLLSRSISLSGHALIMHTYHIRKTIKNILLNNDIKSYDNNLAFWHLRPLTTMTNLINQLHQSSISEDKFKSQMKVYLLMPFPIHKQNTERYNKLIQKLSQSGNENSFLLYQLLDIDKL